MTVFSQHFGQPVVPGYWLESAVYGLDGWLRRRQGVFEYCDNHDCIFRIQHVEADAPLTLPDGTRIEPGMRLLNLHLWNEHLPLMPPEGATLGWAHHFSRTLQNSLQLLADYLDETPERDDIAALRADMRLATAARSAQLVRVMSRYGFEPAADVLRPGTAHASGLHHLGENILIFLLVLATNPGAAGPPILRRDHKLVYLSRAVLERRYGRACTDRDGRSRKAC